MKSFKEYFFDFLVTFLAVCITFLLDLGHDQLDDRSKEKDYMTSLISDLRTDTTYLDSFAVHKEEQIHYVDTLFNSFDSHTMAVKSSGDAYYYARMLVAKWAFFMRDGTLQQLKSGGLRVVENNIVVDSLLAYANLYTDYLALQSLEDRQKDDYRMALTKVFKAYVFSDMLDTGYDISPPEGNPALMSIRKEDLNELLSLAHFIRKNEHSEADALLNLKRQATRLIILIHEKYKL
jgi:hypothetical protein